MTTYNWMGVVLFVGIYCATFLFTGSPELLINGIGLSIVISGTLGALLLSYPLADLMKASMVARNTYAGRMLTPEKIIMILKELAIQSRSKGVLALENYSEQTTVGFLRRALHLLVDGFSEQEIEEILHNEMAYFKQRRIQNERIFRHGARLAPAFGVAGSVIGLMAMISGIQNPDSIVQSIPVALTSTLYGILLSNFVLTPVAEGIHAKTERELLLQRLVTDGVLTISREPNPSRLAIKLESFLTPAERNNENRALARLGLSLEKNL